MFKNQKLFIMMSLFFAVTASKTMLAQKKVPTFTVEQVIPHSAENVWHVVGVDYGVAVNSHPKILASEYVEGLLKAEEGAERVCYFNEKQTRLLKERMVSHNPEHMTLSSRFFMLINFLSTLSRHVGLIKLNLLITIHQGFFLK